MQEDVMNIILSEFFFGGSLSCINYFVYLLVQFVIEIVVISCLSRCIGYVVVFWVKLDVEYCYNSINYIQSNQVKVGECCGYEVEVEEWYQVVSMYYVDNYCIINYYDYVIGDIQIIGYYFRNCIQYVLYFVGINRQCNDDGWNSYMYCLQEQRRNVDSGNCCQVVVISSFICSVLESNGNSMNDDGQYLVCSGQRDCQCDICINVLMICDNQNGRNDRSQSGVRCNCSIDVYLVQCDYFQCIIDNNIGFYIFKNDIYQGICDQWMVKLKFIED